MSDKGMDPKDKLKNNMYVQLFIEFFTLGLFTFGGGGAMAAVLQDRVTEKRHWLTNEETLDCIAISQSLPGVLAVNMSVFVGYKKKGLAGALISWFGMVLPSFVIIIVIAMFLGRIDQNPYVQGALTGIRAAATGLIGFTVYKMGSKTLKSGKFGKASVIFNWLMMTVAFVLIAFFKLDSALVILLAIICGVAFVFIASKKYAGGEAMK